MMVCFARCFLRLLSVRVIFFFFFVTEAESCLPRHYLDWLAGVDDSHIVRVMVTCMWRWGMRSICLRIEGLFFVPVQKN